MRYAMLSIINAQAESIKIVYDEKSYIILGGNSFYIPIKEESIIKIEHYDFPNQSDTKAEKIINSIAKYSILIIDSAYYFSEIEENASIVVKNGCYEYSTGDFGYLYFDISNNCCKCSLYSCDAINQEEVLRMQKIIRFGECYDFPPFSLVGALYKYNKIKKMCSAKSIFNFLEEKTGDG